MCLHTHGKCFEETAQITILSDFFIVSSHLNVIYKIYRVYHCELITKVKHIYSITYLCHMFLWIMHIVNFCGHLYVISLNKRK